MYYLIFVLFRIIQLGLIVFIVNSFMYITHYTNVLWTLV